MAYDPDNLFAKIIRGDIPCVKIYEDDETFSFMDIFPQSKGHTLVVPKAGGEDLFGTEDDAVAAAIKTTRKVAAAVDRALTPDGVMVAQFNRTAAGQSVFHLHFHIIPRWEGAPLLKHNTEQVNVDDLTLLARSIIAELS